jgi:hypothetical protein
MAAKINDDSVFTVLPGVGHVDRRTLGRRRPAGNLLDGVDDELHAARQVDASPTCCRCLNT